MERVTFVNNKALVPDGPGRYAKLPVQPHKPQSKLARLAQKALTCCFGKQWTPAVVGKQKYWVKIDLLVGKFGCNKRSLQKLKQPLDLQTFARQRALRHSTQKKPTEPSKEMVAQAGRTFLEKHSPHGHLVGVLEPEKISKLVHALNLEAKLPKMSQERIAVILSTHIGDGSFKAVYNGFIINASEKEKKVAIARLQNGAYGGDLLRENELAKLFSPDDHVVAPAIRLIWDNNGRHTLIMPLYDGDATKVPPNERQGVALGASKGLAALHREGYTHRDLKPDNIFRKGGKGYLADLGLAAKGTNVPVFGNMLYRAPEVFNSDAMLNEATDIWALGCLLYEIYEGKPIHLLEALNKLGPSGFIQGISKVKQKEVWSMLSYSRTPKAVQRLIKSCLHLDPKKRPAAEDVHAVLKEVGSSSKLQDANEVDLTGFAQLFETSEN